jgi:hypothetical protein
MQAFAAWNTAREVLFAGHPTLGSYASSVRTGRNAKIGRAR